MRVGDGAIRQIDLGHGIGHIHRLIGATSMHAASSAYGFGSTPPRRARLDFRAILARWREYTPPDAFDAHAGQLGVDPSALHRMDVVYCPERRAWAFPMHDDRRQIVGFRLRTEDGAKFALPGSRAGAFIPSGLESRPPLLICEGPTDVAAALTLGFHAIGRPSCSGATGIIMDMLQNGRRRDVIVVADADAPGRGGAKRLADRLLGICRTVRVITTAPYKDVREWVRAGATRALLDVRIHNAAIHRTDDVSRGRST